MASVLSRIQPLLDDAKRFLLRYKDRPVHIRTHIDGDGATSQIIIKQALKKAGFKIATYVDEQGNRRPSVKGWVWISNVEVEKLFKESKKGDIIILVDFGSKEITQPVGSRGRIDIAASLPDRIILILDHHNFDPRRIPRSPRVKFVNPQLVGENGSSATLCYLFARTLLNSAIPKLALLGLVGAHTDHEELHKGLNKVLVAESKVKYVPPSVLSSRETSLWKFLQNKDVATAILIQLIHNRQVLPPGNDVELEIIKKEINEFLARKNIKPYTRFSTASKYFTASDDVELLSASNRITTKIASMLPPEKRKNYLLIVKQYRQGVYLADFEGKGELTEAGYFGSRITKATNLFEEVGQSVIDSLERYVIYNETEEFNSIVKKAQEEEYSQAGVLLRSILGVGAVRHKISLYSREHFFMCSIEEFLPRMKAKTPNIINGVLANPRSPFFFPSLLAALKYSYKSEGYPLTSEEQYKLAAKHIQKIEEYVSPMQYVLTSFIAKGAYDQIIRRYRIVAPELLRKMIREKKEPKISDPRGMGIIEEFIKVLAARHQRLDIAKGGGHDTIGSFSVYADISPIEVLHVLQVAYENIKYGRINPAEVARMCKEMGMRNIGVYYYILKAYCRYSAVKNECMRLLNSAINDRRKLEQSLSKWRSVQKMSETKKEKDEANIAINSILQEIRRIDNRMKKYLLYGATLPGWMEQENLCNTLPNKIELMTDVNETNIYHYLHKCAKLNLLKPIEVTIGGQRIVHYELTSKGDQLLNFMDREGKRILLFMGKA